jgi:hypothetical protein
MNRPTRKQFSRALYEAYDGPAKTALVQYLQNAGHEIESAEVKLAWDGDWPTHWKDIRILERKSRLIEKYEGENGVLNFYIFRKDLKQAWRIKDTSLTKDRLGEAKGRNILKGELFYHVPYTEAELINIA